VELALIEGHEVLLLVVGEAALVGHDLALHLEDRGGRPFASKPAGDQLALEFVEDGLAGHALGEADEGEVLDAGFEDTEVERQNLVGGREKARSKKGVLSWYPVA
jgi:hypothetical protein